MPFAFGALASFAVLFSAAAAAVGLVGTWGLPVGAVALVVAAVMAAGAMESDDPFGVEDLARQREALGSGVATRPAPGEAKSELTRRSLGLEAARGR